MVCGLLHHVMPECADASRVFFRVAQVGKSVSGIGRQPKLFVRRLGVVQLVHHTGGYKVVGCAVDKEHGEAALA